MGNKPVYLKRMVSAICVVVVLIGVWTGLRYIIYDDTASYTRVMMHELYSQKKIDVLFCGASLAYRSFDTKLLDEQLGVNTFNAGSSSQSIDVTYYLIKEAARTSEIKRVVLELSPIMAMYMDIDARDLSGMVSVYAISDYMRWSPSKLQLLLNAARPDLFINHFFVARRNWRQLGHIGALRKCVAGKNTSSYKNYEYDFLKHENEAYAGKGYVASTVRIKDGTFNDTYGSNAFSVDRINDDWYLYLDKIIDFCKNSGIELTLVCAPLSEYLVSCYGKEYDKYHNMLSKIAKNAGLAFWDFTLCKAQYLPLDAEDYQDSAHLNMFGAELFSGLFGDILRDDLSVDDLFYENTRQKLQERAPAVLGLISEKEKRRIISNKENALEYEITIVPDNRERYELQHYVTNTEFRVREGETGTISITSRVVGGSDTRTYFFVY